MKRNANARERPGPEAYRQRMQSAVRNGRADWYRIRNEASGTGPTSASIDLYDVIGGWWGVSAADFVRDLRQVDTDEIQLHINSPGGDVYDGIAILNALRQHKAKVVVTVDGLAASAASFIAMAGDEVVMGRNSELMIHDAWGITIGNAGDMRAVADDLDRISDNIASIYAEKAGGTVADWRTAMLAETWYSAQEAVDAGLADRVDGAADDNGPDGDAAKDRFDTSVFAHAGRQDAPPPPPGPNIHPSPASLLAHLDLLDFELTQKGTT